MITKNELNKRQRLDDILGCLLKRQFDKIFKKYGKPKIGRWIYCKYCYKNVHPEVDYLEGLVRCSECNYGLAPLDEVIEAGSYQKWWDKLSRDFYERNKDFFKEMEPIWAKQERRAKK